MKTSNEKKFRLIIFFLIAVIVLFFVGIVYQFVVIKQLESQVNASHETFIRNVIGETLFW